MSFPRISLLTAALLLAGCGGGGGGGSTGALNLGITDAPVDNATKVYVEVDGVEVQGPNGRQSFDFAPQQIELTSLTGGAAQSLLNGVTLPAGHYEWLRLKVNTATSYLELMDGSQHQITIPSGAQTGLKVVRGFDVPVGGTADFTIDFDLRQSLVNANSGYMLKPVLRVVDNTQVGTISGTVDLAHYGCAATGDAVYIYQGQNVTPTDINTTASGSGPLTVAPVVDRNGTGQYTYTAAFLPAGSYTVALTCQASQDQPETTETLAFADKYNVTVTTGQVTTQAFPTP